MRKIKDPKHVLTTELDALVANTMSHSYEQDTDPKYLNFISPSGFPYCALRNLYEFINNGGDPVVGEWSHSGTYYTSVGGDLHELLQNNIVSCNPKTTLVIYGNWNCPACDSTIIFSPRPKKCNTCGTKGSYLTYQEIKVNRKPTYGKIDLVVKLGKYFYIIDFKTTNLAKVQKHNNGIIQFPDNVNRLQITTYAPMLESQYGVKVRGCFLIYLPRDNPVVFRSVVPIMLSKSDIKDLSNVLDVFNESHTLVRHIANLLKESNFTSSDFKPAIKQANKIKICKSVQHYNDTYHNHFDPCPLVDDCFKSISKPFKLAIKSWNETNDK